MKRKPTKRSTEGQQALDDFRDRWAGKRCMACSAIGHHIHHIVYRDGIARHDDQRNFAWLCFPCHAAHHQRGLANFFGRPVENLTTETILRLKRELDPEHWDLMFLRKLACVREGYVNMNFGRGME